MDSHSQKISSWTFKLTNKRRPQVGTRQKVLSKVAVVSLASLFTLSEGSTASAVALRNLHSAGPDTTAREFRVSPASVLSVQATAQDRARRAIEQTEVLLQSVRESSYSELAGIDIQVRSFHSASDYFRTRFSVRSYLTFRRMQFFLEINPLLFALGAPDEAVRAIIAHELEHVLYLSRRSRTRMLSLARLAAPDFTARFERRADLGAIGRGYGPGLIEYRRWLYKNIPPGAVPEKRRDYFSPEEISAIQTILKDRPEKLAYWLKHVPRNLEDITQL